MNTTLASHDFYRLLNAEHDDPFGVLGLHKTNGLWVVRAFRPDAKELEVIDRHHPERHFPANRIANEGLFEAPLTGVTEAFDYLLQVTTWSGGQTFGLGSGQEATVLQRFHSAASVLGMPKPSRTILYLPRREVGDQ